jgi:hypothetical protein
MTQTEKTKTVRVRIAVVIDKDGNYGAAGSNGLTKSETIEAAQDMNGDMSFGLIRECWVTVEIPLPQPVEYAAVIETSEVREEEEEEVAA